MYTGRYPTGLCWRHDGVGEGPPRPAPRQGRARAHPQRVTATVPRSGHQPHRHGPTLRGGPGVEAHGIPALHRQGRARRRIPAPVRSRRHGRSVRPHRPHAPRTTPRCLRGARDRGTTSRQCAPTSRRPSKSTTLNTPHANTHATTRKPSPRGSPKPHAKPAPPTPNSSANNWRCSSMAPRPAPGSSTPNLPHRRRHRRRPHRQRHPHGSPVTMSCPEQDDPRLRSSAAGQGWSPTRAIARVSGTPSISRLVIVAARAPRVPFDRSLSAMANTTP